MAESENQQPGAVITPGGAPPAAAPAPPQPTPTPLPPAPQEPVPDSVPTGLIEPEPDQDESSEVAPDTITWTASEFVAHEKSAGWYLGLVIVAVLISGVIFLITRDFISVAVVVVAAMLFGVYGARKPRQLEYRLDHRGVTIGPKEYRFNEFRSFSVVPEGAFSSIVFMPLKRFSPPITIYYAPEDEEKIAGLLANDLPYEEPRRDAVDSLMRRVRF